MKLEINLPDDNPKTHKLMQFLEENGIKYQAFLEGPPCPDHSRVREVEQDRIRERNEYAKFQEFNMSRRLPGWRDRLGKTFGGRDYES